MYRTTLHVSCLNVTRIMNPTCSDVDVIYLYMVVDDDGVIDVAQDGPQLIIYCSI